MTNTVHGLYNPTNWVNSSTPISQANMNNLEKQAAVALHSFNPYLMSAGYVHSGAVCTKDGTNANQLDIASGEAFLIQTDGTLALCDIAADNTHTTTGNPSTTMYLDLNPDGSWSWGTSHSVQANYLPICQVTTDASANIATVTDARPLNPTLFPTLAGLVFMPNQVVTYPGIYGWHFGGANPNAFEPVMDIVPNGATVFTRWWLAYNGGDGHLQFQNTTGNIDAMDLDGSGNVAFAGDVTATGNLFGALGGGPLKAISSTTVTTSGTEQDIPGLTLTIARAGTYLVIVSCQCYLPNFASAIIHLSVNGTDDALVASAGNVSGPTGYASNQQLTQAWVVSVGASQIVKARCFGTGSSILGGGVGGTGGGNASSITAQYLHP